MRFLEVNRHRVIVYLLCFFFFSSRRRHTRWNCDWSSDVCSSDLLRTKAISYTRDHLKEIAAYAIAFASTVVTLSIAYGHKQANSEQLSTDVAARSEERRVGKECRCRWAPYRYKKKA